MDFEDLCPDWISPTHTVAVTGYVFQRGRFLLLKRKEPPLIWAPPGGRLLVSEDPRLGLVREVKEETGLEVKILGLVDYWFGEVPRRGRLLSLDFLTVPFSDEVVLSGEHSDFAWATLSDLESGNPPLGEGPSVYRLSDFQRAAGECRRFMYQMPPPPR